jgi:gliding motility-associated-like protein
MRPLRVSFFTGFTIALLFCSRVSAQQIVVVSEAGVFYSLDISSGNCSVSPLPPPVGYGYSTALYKDTLYYNDGNGDLFRTVLGNVNFLQEIDTGVYSEVLTADANGNLLWIDLMTNDLVIYNPASKIKDTLGVLNYSPAGDLFFYNQLLIMSSSGNQLITVNIQHPDQSTVYMETPDHYFWAMVSTITSCSQHVIYGLEPNPYSDSTNIIAIDMFTKKVLGTYCTVPVKIFDAASVGENGGGVNVPANPFAVNDTIVCTGTSLVLDAGNAGSNYIWDDNSTNETRTVFNPGVYYVTITNAQGCSTLDSITADFTDGPVINLPNDTTVCNGDSVLLNAVYPQTTYTWQDGSTLPVYTVNKPGVFSVQATNKCGTVTKSVTVKYENCLCTFNVPTAFTPNHDGVNDKFLPVSRCLGDGISAYELRVYNRWGQLVFQSKNISLGWDGSYMNNAQPTGGYIWQLSYTDRLNGKTARQSGTVVLIR